MENGVGFVQKVVFRHRLLPWIGPALAILIITATSHLAAARPMVIAHRGASGYLPEHTLPSAALAHGLGADYVEPDVVLTKDGELIVVHDIHLESISDVATKYPNRKRADGRWYAIDFTLAEIKTLLAHERADEDKGYRAAVFPERFPLDRQDFQIPTLKEMVDLVQGLNISRKKAVGLYIEPKDPSFHQAAGQDIAKRLLEVLAERKIPAENLPIIIQCFDSRTLKRLKNEFKTAIPLVQLIAENSWKESDLDYEKMLTPDGMKEIATYANGIGPYINQLVSIDQKSGNPTPTPVVGLARANKLFIHPFTIRRDGLPKFVKSIDDIHKMLFSVLKVDGAFTDFTDLTLAYVNSLK